MRYYNCFQPRLANLNSEPRTLLPQELQSELVPLTYPTPLRLRRWNPMHQENILYRRESLAIETYIGEKVRFLNRYEFVHFPT
ncbi:hypothetical protein ES708_03868 [subsurface metagenome]